MCSRMTLDDTDNLWSWFCVLPQVAWWGKGHLYVFMVTFDALCPFLLTMQIFSLLYHIRRVVADLRVDIIRHPNVRNKVF